MPPLPAEGKDQTATARKSSVRRMSSDNLTDTLPSFRGERCSCLPKLKGEDVAGLLTSIGTVLDTIQSTEQVPGTYAGRTMKFGLAFLIFFAVNLWASSLTTSLVSSSLLSGRPNSLSDASARGLTICSAGVLGQRLAAAEEVPGPGQQWSPSTVQPLIRLPPYEPGVAGNIFGILRALDRDICQAVCSADVETRDFRMRAVHDRV